MILQIVLRLPYKVPIAKALVALSVLAVAPQRAPFAQFTDRDHHIALAITESVRLAGRKIDFPPRDLQTESHHVEARVASRRPRRK